MSNNRTILKDFLSILVEREIDLDAKLMVMNRTKHWFIRDSIRVNLKLQDRINRILSRI